ncbi:putative galactosylceramide sulfotransferase isoform X2 [Apostichopus japonicus]|uniref:Putative galactosylceramide sulfotransferase isoform X2 n=1 Tax=Stichopus japonicus TaxID=307972 RepID=A0A2G8KVG6_STIJA|nr:putative galactosylceramide sulfotransferase isoform X2 [Apostichopus japonicus]
MGIENLTFALPSTGFILGYQTFSQEMLLRQPTDEGFNVLVNNVPFHRANMEKVMKPTAKYVSILREPVSRWYSVVEYYSLFKLALRLTKEQYEAIKTSPLDDFLSAIAKCKYFSCSLGYNGQLFDLGLTEKVYYTDEHVIQKKIKTIEEELDLVLIAEYFDESLLLLKKMMCWTFEDIMYIKKKQRRNVSREPTRIEQANAIRKWNKGDVMLYQRFNRTLWNKINKYGPNFQKDLRRFREMNDVTTKSCVNTTSSDINGNYILQNEVTFAKT